MSLISILDLPDLPMTKIFSYLTMADRLGAELVCWRWNRLAKDKDCWRHFHALRHRTLLNLVNGKGFSKNGISRLISRFGKFINELDFDEFSIPYKNRYLNLDLLELIILQIDGKQIRHLKFEMPPFFVSAVIKQLHQLAKKLPELKTLVIEGIMDLELSIQFAMNCPKLEFFDPGKVPPSFDLENSGLVFPASVKNIRIKNKLLNFTKIAQECPNLVSLEGNFYHLEKNEAKDQLFSRPFGVSGHLGNILGQAMVTTQCFENIRALEIGSNMDATEFMSIGQKCPHLEHLDAWLCEPYMPGMNDLKRGEIFASNLVDNFGTLSFVFGNLKSLKLKNNNAIQYILPLIKNGNFQQLECINVSNDYIQNIGHIIALLDNCPNLSHLFADCLTIDVVCEIIKRKKDCQLRQMRFDRSIRKRLRQICKFLEEIYDQIKIPENEDNPGIVRIFCRNVLGASQSILFGYGRLHPWLKVFNNYENPWPIPLPLKRARFDGLSEIPSFLDS